MGEQISNYSPEGKPDAAEKLTRSPFTVCVIGNPQNKRATKETLELLRESTGPIIPNGLGFADEPTSADLLIILDARPGEFAEYAKSAQVVLVTAQNRSKQSLNTYLRECQQKSGEAWKNVKVVNIDPKSNDRLVQKWWELNVVVFGIAESVDQSRKL